MRFLFFNIFKITTFKFFKIIKGAFPENLRSLAQNMKEIDFLRFFEFQRKLTHKFSVHTFVSKTFIKITISQKFNKIFLFCKNWLVVCTSSFHIRSNVVFSKKNCRPLPMPLTNRFKFYVLLKTCDLNFLNNDQ